MGVAWCCPALVLGWEREGVRGRVGVVIFLAARVNCPKAHLRCPLPTSATTSFPYTCPNARLPSVNILARSPPSSPTVRLSPTHACPSVRPSTPFRVPDLVRPVQAARALLIITIRCPRLTNPEAIAPPTRLRQSRALFTPPSLVLLSLLFIQLDGCLPYPGRILASQRCAGKEIRLCGALVPPIYRVRPLAGDLNFAPAARPPSTEIYARRAVKSEL